MRFMITNVTISRTYNKVEPGYQFPGMRTICVHIDTAYWSSAVTRLNYAIPFISKSMV